MIEITTRAVGEDAVEGTADGVAPEAALGGCAPSEPNSRERFGVHPAFTQRVTGANPGNGFMRKRLRRSAAPHLPFPG